MQDHIGQWTSSASGHLSRDANGDEKTDYSRWRLVDRQGRQSWRYLESDEENEKWPQTVYEKHFLGLDTVSRMLSEHKFQDQQMLTLCPGLARLAQGANPVAGCP